MFRRKNLIRNINADPADRCVRRTLNPIAALAASLLAAILVITTPSLAQRGGGAHVNQSVICVYDCPSIETLNTEDTLKDFRRSMALQATAEQRAAFAKVSQYAEAAADQLHAFRKSLQPSVTSLELAGHALDQAIEKARASNQNFLASFSAVQKSGLQELVKKLSKADSDLDRQIKALDQILPAAKPDSETIASAAAALDKALASFQNEQLALAREMSILFDADDAGITFSLPPVTNSLAIDGEDITIPTSGAVLRKSSATSAATSSATLATASAESARNIFSLKFVADLSDVQQNITAILRAALSRAPRCGERIDIQQASLTPLAPDSSLVVTDLHFERWVCPTGQARASLGSPSPTEVSDGNATFEVKLTPSLEAAQLNLASEITRVEATGMLRNSLRSGDLGTSLRDQIAAALVAVLQKSADVKSTLPPVAQTSATLQKAQFQDAGADQLNLVLDGQLQFSDEQTKQFAAQLKRSLSAQGTAAP
ncbi:MAG TPA: hypothetical protein VMR02_08845 [Terracidiphilus sp.]|jgi:exonuclease VII small subunit|nr:hypothetical protein [Terracidiphilus sp.]